LIVAKGSGHMITLEKPGVVIDAIQEVMAQVQGK
jgi:hypothetical protein